MTDESLTPQQAKKLRIGLDQMDVLLANPLNGLNVATERKILDIMVLQWSKEAQYLATIPVAEGASRPRFRHPMACRDLSHTYDGDCAHCETIACLHYDNSEAKALRAEYNNGVVNWAALVYNNQDTL